MKIELIIDLKSETTSNLNILMLSYLNFDKKLKTHLKVLSEKNLTWICVLLVEST